MDNQHDIREGGDLTLDAMAGRMKEYLWTTQGVSLAISTCRELLALAFTGMDPSPAREARLAEIMARVGHPVDRQGDGAVPDAVVAEAMRVFRSLPHPTSMSSDAEMRKVLEAVWPRSVAPTPPAPVGLVEADPVAAILALSCDEQFAAAKRIAGNIGYELAAEQQIDPGEPVRIAYTNWRGEATTPTIVPTRIFWGSNEYHPDPCWLIEALDVAKGELRTYDPAKIGGWGGAALSDQTGGAGTIIDRPMPDFDFTPPAFLAMLRRMVAEGKGLAIILPEKATRDMLAWAEAQTGGAVPAGDLRPGLKEALRILEKIGAPPTDRETRSYATWFAGKIRARLTEQPGGEPGAAGETVSGWLPINTAPYGQEVEVRAGMMRFRAKLVRDGSTNEDGETCDQWQATREGEHPPCWSGGACWESNADLSPSLHPDRWRPLTTSADGHGRSTSAPDAGEVNAEACRYLENLLVLLRKKHYPDVPQFMPMSGDLIGMLTQIDNMTTGLERRSALPGSTP